MAVRTAVLYRGGGASGTLATVPAGRTWIAKDVTLYNRAGSSNYLSLYVQSVGGDPTPFYTGTLAPDQVVRLTGLFVVLEPGETIRIYNDTGGSAGIAVCGADLDGVAP